MKNMSMIAGLVFILAVTLAAQQPSSMFIQDVSWSADGKYLAFTGMHDFDQQAHTFKADIYVVRTDGSDVRMISREDRNEFYTAWAKGRIAFSAESPGTKDSDIFTANPDGSDLRQITKGPGKNTTPSMSKDGRLIAFISTRDVAKHQIYISNSDGSNVTRLTKDDTVGYFNPQISPDGKRIVYYAEKGDSLDQVWVMNAGGSNQKLLTAGIGHNIFPGWSPDSNRIIFSSSKRNKDDQGTYVDGSYLYTINADGSSLARLGNIKSFFARFSPNGKKIAYVAGKFPDAAIYISNADGSGIRKVTK